MINEIVETIATVFEGIFLIWFVPAFLKTSLKMGKKPWTFLLPILLVAFQLVADHFLEGFDLVALTGAFLIVLAFSFAIGQWKRQKFGTVLAACLFMTVEMFSASIVYAVFSLFIDNLDTLIQGSDGNARIIYLITAFVIRFILFKLIIVLFRSNDGLDRKNGVFVLAWFSMTAVGLGILMYILSVSNAIPSVAILMLVAILTLSNVALYFTIYQIQKLQKKEFEVALLQERLKNAQKTSDEAKNIWDNIRRVRHEMKNYLTVISGRLNMGDIEGCQNYLSELTGTVEHFGNIVKTDNSIIDYLINSKLSSLDSIKVIVSGYVGDFDDIDDVDLACLVGNIIDNAVEAERKIEDENKRIIELHFLVKNQNRIIVCKNAIEKSVIESNPKLSTTKDKPTLHGVGHLVIDEIAAKYYGFVDYSETEGMFIVKVIIPKP